MSQWLYNFTGKNGKLIFNISENLIFCFITRFFFR